jgi:hypothetical protein
MMGCAPMYLQITVVSLLKNTGMGDVSAQANPWAISYISPRLMAPYLRLPSAVLIISNWVYCFQAKRLLLASCLTASYRDLKKKPCADCRLLPH